MPWHPSWQMSLPGFCKHVLLSMLPSPFPWYKHGFPTLQLWRGSNCNGTSLSSQQLGGWGRRILPSWPPWATQEDYLKNRLIVLTECHPSDSALEPSAWLLSGQPAFTKSQGHRTTKFPYCFLFPKLALQKSWPVLTSSVCNTWAPFHITLGRWGTPMQKHIQKSKVSRVSISQSFKDYTVWTCNSGQIDRLTDVQMLRDASRKKKDAVSSPAMPYSTSHLPKSGWSYPKMPFFP